MIRFLLPAFEEAEAGIVLPTLGAFPAMRQGAFTFAMEEVRCATWLLLLPAANSDCAALTFPMGLRVPPAICSTLKLSFSRYFWRKRAG